MNQRTVWPKIKFPLLLLIAFLFAAIWVGVGRLTFGVFGWMAFITLFMFTPIIALYGIIVSIIVAVRQRTYRFRKWGPFMTWVVITLAALFCVGFFMPDGGDTPESLGSGLSVMLLDRTNAAWVGISGTVMMLSAFIAVVSGLIALVLACVERQPRREP